MKRACLCVLLALDAIVAAHAADFSFGRPERLLLERNVAASVAIGDANGDGRNDLALTGAVSHGSRRVSIFLQRPDGSLAEPVHLMLPAPAGPHVEPVAFADLDRDGAAEIAVGTYDGLTMVRLDGAGGLSIMAEVGGKGCTVLAVGDIEGDGNADIACHDWKETATVFYGNGSGGFHSVIQVRTPLGSYNLGYEYNRDMRLADVTGDGRIDLVMTASNINSFFVMPNNGRGSFWPANVYTHPLTASRVWPLALEVADLDGDGSNEVITASPDNRPDSALNVYRRGTNGYLALSERIPVRDSPTAILAGDLDGDGDPELLAAHFAFNTLSVFGIAAPELGNERRFHLPGFGNHMRLQYQGRANGIALGDLNADGCPDLAAATYSGVQVLYGCRPTTPRALPVSDFDGDGVSDVVWHQSSTGELYFWPWVSGDAWLECAIWHQMCPRSVTGDFEPQVVGDFDGDGTSDMFWRERSTGANRIYFSLFFPKDITPVGSQAWQVVGAGDFDGDGRADLLWRNSSTGGNSIWPSGNSALSHAIATVNDLGWKVATVGDFDGDRRSDILWRHSGTGRNAIWRSGRHDLSQAVSTVSNTQWAVVGAGDFNGDGRDDVVWRNTGTGANAIWLSANSSTAVSVTPMTDLAWTIAAIGDYNGDGRADLMWRNTSTGANAIWRAGDSRQQQAVEDVRTTRRVIP